MGTVFFAGDPPRRKRIKLEADPACVAAHDGQPLLSEEVIVDDDGTLRNVFVYVKRGLEGRVFDRPAEPVELDQIGCRYHPHVIGMQVKQMLRIKNSDPTTHNIHAAPLSNPEFNKGQVERSTDLKTTFARAEVMIPVKCDVHPWMSAYIGVLDHPFFAVTGDDGTFTFEGLPPGEYEIEAWHETLGTITQAISLAPQVAVEIVFTFRP